MRIKRPEGGIQEGDLTPMIDMTFQLIAFFMVLINFTQSDQNDKVKLPESTLAKPPEAPLDYPITLHVIGRDSDVKGDVILGGEPLSIDNLVPKLNRERQLLELDAERSINDATIIIRADRHAKTGKIQKIIEVCQQQKFDRFALRAKEDVGNN